MKDDVMPSRTATQEAKRHQEEVEQKKKATEVATQNMLNDALNQMLQIRNTKRSKLAHM